MSLCEDLIDGEKLPPGIKPAVKKNLSSFVKAVRKLRRAALKVSFPARFVRADGQGRPVEDLIRLVIEEVRYEEHLRNHDPQSFEQRWENVQELVSSVSILELTAQINYSVIVAEEHQKQTTTDGEGDEGDRPVGFVSANALPLVENPPSPPAAAKPLHPMFRGGSSSSRSRSTSLAPENSHRQSNRTRVKVEDDVIEILSSEDELDAPSPPPVAVVNEDGES